MHKHAVRPRGARHRRMPVVASRELLCQSRKNWKLLWCETLQDLSRSGASSAGRIRGHKTALIDSWVGSTRRITRTGPAELLENVRELVAGVDRHYKIRTLRDRTRCPVQHIRFASRKDTQSRRLAGFGVTAADHREPQ